MTTRTRRLLAMLAGVPLLLTTAPAGAATHPAVLDHVGSTTKVVLVTSASWTATTATATLWQKHSGSWAAVRSSMPARVGRTGFKTDRHEGDGSTPAGTFLFRYAFGGQPNPGTTMAWRSIVPRSCWSGERADYNRWVSRVCTSRDEDLWRLRTLPYRFAAVIGFNDSPPTWGKGSAIFLHQTTGQATSGCVALSANDILATVRWMTPGTKIVMGPRSYVASL
jgi:L,D-peptidoglycan transpeptidase YkuD (ErfK/YbiS/YcfS/YnhG family)